MVRMEIEKERKEKKKKKERPAMPNRRPIKNSGYCINYRKDVETINMRLILFLIIFIFFKLLNSYLSELDNNNKKNIMKR